MPNLAVSSRPGALTTYVYPAGYDSTKLGLGPNIIQANDAGNEGKWVGPQPPQLARPIETGLLVPNVQPDAVKWSTRYDWVFFADNAAASLTRRFTAWKFDKLATNNAWSLQGSIVLTMPSSAGTYTNRGHRVSYEKYVTGTAAISNGSPTVTGTSTTWNADRIFAGSRIGFGSTDPSQIAVWYEVSAIGGDTAITLTTNFAEANFSGAYVIEDLRILFGLTNATANLGGLFMVAGLRFEAFTPAGNALAAAVATDKVRAVYWLDDGNVTNNATNQTAGGTAIGTRTNWTTQMVYMLDAAAGQSRFQKSNFRAAMTLATGRTTAGPFVCNTAQAAVTGTVSQNDALCIATPAHGPRNGVETLFWVTTSRVYSAITSGITSGSTTFQNGVMVENPPGASTTFALSAALNTIAYDPLSDRFFVGTSGATFFSHYFTQYREDAGQLDRIIMFNPRRSDQTTEDATVAIFPVTLGLGATVAILNGMCYLANPGTTAITNLIYAFPIGVDWEYASATSCRAVFPALAIAGFAQLVAAYVSVVEVIGGKTGTNLGQEPNAVRVSYRTTGISDNSGSWNLLDYAGDLSGVAVGAATQIQLMVEFRMLTWTCLPPRVTRVAVEGSGSAMDPHFQASQAKSSVAAKQFAFRYSTAFGGTVPQLFLRIIDGVTGSTLVTDDSVAKAAGTWEKSTDGTTWGAFSTTDRANETTYLRFTPTSIADNVNALAWVALS